MRQAFLVIAAVILVSFIMLGFAANNNQFNMLTGNVIGERSPGLLYIGSEPRKASIFIDNNLI